MFNIAVQLVLFTSKAIIIVALILLLLVGIIALLSRGKDSAEGRLRIKNLSQKYQETCDALLEEVLNKDEFKKYAKQRKSEDKLKAKNPTAKKKVYVLNFCGDIKASAVTSLREEVTAVIGIAKPGDEVVVCLESPGGMVHTYGLAAAQLARFREYQIPLTVSVDKVAASGGYLMACVANKILAAPFAIIGSIGVIVQIPNFNRLLKEKHVDFEQLTAGSFKRTLTMFGHNTDEGRKKMQEEIEEIHELFKNSIAGYRPQIDLNKVATGEHWLGAQAIALKLVDEVKTSDDYLLEQSKHADLFELSYQMKKTFMSKFTSAANSFKETLFSTNLPL